MASQRDKKLVISSRNATAILCSLATVVVLLRLLSRKVSDVKFGWDDAFVIIALVGGITQVVRIQSIKLYQLFAWATAAAVFWRVSAFLDGPPDFQTLRTEKHVQNSTPTMVLTIPNLSRLFFSCKTPTTVAPPLSNSQYSYFTVASFPSMYFASPPSLLSVS